MAHSDPQMTPLGVPSATADDGAPAHHDTAATVARAEGGDADADQAEADRARERYRREPMAVLEPDARIAPWLDPHERVVAVRSPALVERRQPAPGSAGPTGIPGDLYVTTRRLVMVGRPTLSFGLEAIAETLLSGERLLLVMRDGAGVTLEVTRPRLLRVEIATARAAARR